MFWSSPFWKVTTSVLWDPHSLLVCSLKMWVVTSATQREGQVASGETCIAKSYAQTWHMLSCIIICWCLKFIQSSLFKVWVHLWKHTWMPAGTKHYLANYLKQVWSVFLVTRVSHQHPHTASSTDPHHLKRKPQNRGRSTGKGWHELPWITPW